VRWFEAAPDAEVLPFESVILRTDWEIDPWMDAPVGEVADAPRSTDLTRAPRGSGRGHVCGTEEQFREGAHYDADAPPVLYGGSGLPHCCGLWPVQRGGAGAGGRIGIVVEPPVTPIVGGTCGDPAEIELGVTYSSSWSGTEGLLRYWWPGPLVLDTRYRIVTTSTESTRDYLVSGGADPCDVDVIIASGTFAVACRSGLNDVLSDGGLTLTVGDLIAGDPFDFTFRIEVGECP